MSGGLLLTPDADLPPAPAVPAPWTLEGDGWILLLRLPGEIVGAPHNLTEPLRGRPVGGPSVVMFVDYASSPAGPYRELLYVPGRFEQPGGRRAWSVTRIYVSTWASVVNGRRNWGIPKDHAEFLREPAGPGERISVSVGGRPIASLELTHRGPALPVHAGLLPAAWRRLAQFHAGRRFEFAPAATGRAALARVQAMHGEPPWFPELQRGRVSMALRIPRFRLRFPAAG